MSNSPVLAGRKEEHSPHKTFNIHATYQRILKDEEISTPLAAILALTELIEASNGELKVQQCP